MSLHPPPIRGSFDASKEAFLIIAQDKTVGTVYVLCQVEYLISGDKSVVEAIFVPSFTGGLELPYVGNENGLNFFGPGLNLSTDNYQIAEAIPEYTALGLVIKSISPLPLQYANGILSRVPFGTSASYTQLTVEVSPNIGQSGNTYLARSFVGPGILNTTNPLPMKVSITPSVSFFINGTQVYASYPYQISSSSSGGQFPFRNFQPALSTDKRMTDYNKTVPGTDSYYTLSTLPKTNNLRLNEVNVYDAGTTSQIQVVFPGNVMTNPSPPTYDLHPKNFDPGNTSFYLIPTSYYPINFDIATMAPKQCSVLGGGGNADASTVLNYMYFAWGSGYPGADPQGKGPLTNCGPGFLESGKYPRSLCGWTTSNECFRSYFYDYCGQGESCGTCYGPCPSDEPFCEPNESFTKIFHVAGTPFLCSGQAEPLAQINWKAIIIVLAVVFFIFLILIMAVIFNVRSKSNPRDSIINS